MLNSKSKFLFLCAFLSFLPLITYFISSFLKFNLCVSYVILGVIFTIAGYIFFKQNISPLNSIFITLDKMKDGDFSYINKENPDSMSLSETFNTKISLVCQTVRELVFQLENNAKNLYSSGEVLKDISTSSAGIANEVASTVEQLANGATEQVSEITQCTKNIEDITNTSNDINTQVKHIATIADEFVNIAIQGKQDIESTLEKVMEIKNSSENTAEQITYLGKIGSEISEIVDLITGISSQINLLALNAAIEAARAGDHGKGFAVVADEVKKLAVKSAESANEIKEMVTKVQDESQKAVMSTNSSLVKVEEGVNAFQIIRENFEKIYEQSKIIDKESNTINKSITELVNKNNSINSAMSVVSHVTETNAAAAEEIAASTEEHSAGTQELDKHAQDLLILARNLNVTSSVFKIDSKPVIFFWSKKLFTEIVEIDYQHYQIVNHINLLYQKYLDKSSPRELLTVLLSLFEITKDHFSYEQKLMVQHGYPRTQQHIPEHTTLLNDLQKFAKAFENHTAEIDDSFMEFLRNWLMQHILQEDMQYVSFFKSKGLR